MEGLPNSFNDATKLTKSHIPASNIPARLLSPNIPAGERQTRQKQGRPLEKEIAIQGRVQSHNPMIKL